MRGVSQLFLARFGPGLQACACLGAVPLTRRLRAVHSRGWGAEENADLRPLRAQRAAEAIPQRLRHGLRARLVYAILHGAPEEKVKNEKTQRPDARDATMLCGVKARGSAY